MRDQAFSVLRSFRSARASSRRFALLAIMRISSTCLVFLVVLGTASGQTAPRPGRRTEPLEKYGMPPAAPGTYRLESSPRMISPYGAFTSFQVNVDANGNNIVGERADDFS
jgi:hypothetical protein